MPRSKQPKETKGNEMKTRLGSVHRRGKKGIYVAEWMFRGKRFNVSTKTTNKAEAERKLEEWTRPFLLKDEGATIENMVAKVRDIRSASVCPIEDIIQRVREETDWAEGTAGHREAIIQRFVDWARNGGTKARDITEVTEDEAKEFIKSLPFTDGTVNNYRMALAHAWNILKSPVNPWKSVKKRRVKNVSREPLTHEEVRRILEHTEGWKKTMILLGYSTGMRLSDCVSLRWENIDFDRGTYGMIHKVPVKTRKTGKEIRVPVSKELREHLEAIGIKSHGWIFPDIQNECSQNINDWVNEAMRSWISPDTEIFAEVGGRRRTLVGFHSLRHLFVSDLGNQGVPLQMVRTMVGHLSDEMTMKYFHAQDDALDSIMMNRKG